MILDQLSRKFGKTRVKRAIQSDHPAKIDKSFNVNII